MGSARGKGRRLRSAVPRTMPENTGSSARARCYSELLSVYPTSVTIAAQVRIGVTAVDLRPGGNMAAVFHTVQNFRTQNVALRDSRELPPNGRK